MGSKQLRHDLIVRSTAFALIALALYLNASVAGMYRNSQSDFFQDYTAARAFLHGESLYQVNPHPHPPLAIFITAPLGFLELGTAHMCHAVLSMLSVVILCDLLSVAWDRRELFLPLVALILLWPEFRGVVGLGAFSAIIALFVSLSVVSLNRGFDGRSGFYLAVAASLKVYPAFLIVPLIGLGYSKTIKSFAVSLIALHLPILLLLGVEPFREWFQIGIPFVLQCVDNPINASMPGYIFRMLGPSGGYREPIFESPLLAQAMSAALSLLGIAGSFVFARRMRASFLLQREAACPALLFGLCCILATQTITWTHYFIVLVPALFWSGVNLGASSRGTKLTFFSACFLLLGWEVIFRHSESDFAVYVHSLPTYTEGIIPLLGLALLGLTISRLAAEQTAKKRASAFS